MTAPVRYIVVPPQPGKAMLACRCGVVLDANQMYRYRPAGGSRNTLALRPICCRACATGGAA